MSKELDYLDELLSYKPLTLNQKTIIEYIKEKIQRLEQIDNTNPSEALESLEILHSEAKIESGWIKERVITYAEEFEHNDRIKPYYDTIKQALLQAQKDKAEIEKLKRENCILKA